MKLALLILCGLLAVAEANAAWGCDRGAARSGAVAVRARAISEPAFAPAPLRSAAEVEILTDSSGRQWRLDMRTGQATPLGTGGRQPAALRFQSGSAWGR